MNAPADIGILLDDGREGKLRFLELIRPHLRPGMRILDVGAGRDPTLRAEHRPIGVHYVGMDEEPHELELAAPFYDEVRVGDITRHDPSLDGSFDLILSWQVFEHVRRPRDAYANIHRYLRPGGVYGGRLTARHAWFAILNRWLPHRTTRWLLSRLSGRKPDSVFKAYYEDATIDRLRDIFGTWQRHRIWAEYAGHEYFEFSRVMLAAYYRYLRLTSRWPRLATYYVVIAEKARSQPGE